MSEHNLNKKFTSSRESSSSPKRNSERSLTSGLPDESSSGMIENPVRQQDPNVSDPTVYFSKRGRS